ncbi:MAG: type II secretion system protein [Candidatus Levybacteria bacterium]|nr:type II secretion system protein [Candidatus Levybacteria bacterium]
MKFLFLNIFKSFRSQNGQSLVELLIAIGLATLILPALLTGLSAGRGGRAQQEQRLEASAYLKQTQEAVRSIAQRGWSNIETNGIYHSVVSGGQFVLANGAQSIDGYSISIVVGDTYRDGAGAITSSGGTIDSSTKKVITNVSWNTPFVSTVSTTSYYTRHKNQVYNETTQSQFSVGTFDNMQATNVTGGELKLINNNKAKWCSPAFSTATIDLPDGPPVAVAATANSTTSVPNDVYVATAPTTSNSIKMAYINVTADTAVPTATLRGKFTVNSSEFSPGYSPSGGTGLDNNFKTTDVKYYKSSGNNTYALLGTNLPNKEVIAVLVNDDNPANDETSAGEFEDPVNNIYKYKTFFNTKIHANYAASANTGLLTPASNATEVGGDGDGFASNPTRAYTDNNSFAVDTNSGNGTGVDCTGADKDKHRFYNYDIDVPPGANIDGIEVRLDARVDNAAGAPRMCAQISWDGGTTWTTAKTTNNLTTSEATYTLGGAADTWDRSWTDTDFTNSNFRLRVINIASDINRDFSLDWAAVRVSYTNNNFDQSPFGYGATTIAVLEDRGYMASGGYLYSFDLSNIDSKSSGSGLDMLGCRIELSGYECSPSTAAKYGSGATGSNWSTTSPIHPDCSDGGNIELNATNDIFPVKVGSNTYVYVAVGGVTDREFEIVDATSIPTTTSTPAISSNTCGRLSGGNSSWKTISGLDFNSQSGTEEAANSVFAKADGTRAYISSNGGIDGNDNGVPDSKQFYIINTSTKTAPVFLSGTSGTPSYGPTSGFYYGTGANAQLYPRRSLTVLNGERVVLVGSDGTADSNNSEEYQVLDSSTEASPNYCAGINFDQGFNDLTSVSEADSDNFVYMVANTTLNELKIIEGGPDDAVFVSTGSYTSAPFDAASESMFNRFFTTTNVPSQTTLNFQVAVADSVSGSCTNANYVYVGPDGTDGTFFTSSAELPKNSDGSGFENAGRCMRYKVYMTSSDQLQTPTVFDFGVNYSP